MAPLKRRYVGFGNTTPQQMIHNLRTNVCIKMDTKDKDAFKTQGYAQEWDTRKNIITYFKHIGNFKGKLDLRGIANSNIHIRDYNSSSRKNVQHQLFHRREDDRLGK